jgi:hypothetical protein
MYTDQRNGSGIPSGVLRSTAGYDNNLPRFCNPKKAQSFYKPAGLADNKSSV